MNENFIYAEFGDGTYYALNQASITYHPNQELHHFSGGKVVDYSDINNTPYKQSTKSSWLLDGNPPGVYKLTFKNNIPTVFFQEPFYVGKIQFQMIYHSHQSLECVAEGVLK